MLLWQSRFRFGVILLVGVTGGALRTFGVLSANSVITRQFGAVTAVIALSALVIGYSMAIAGISYQVRRSGQADAGHVGLTLTADVILIYGTMLIVTPPASYDRALLLSMASIQLTQLNFGRVFAGWVLAGSTLCYLLLVAIAIESGVAMAWPERLWTLYTFTLVAGVFVVYYGTLRDRLNRIVALFERAEEGDFSIAYDDSADTQPDGITVVGRAYNRMRTQLGSIVLTDGLSGCLNRRGFEQQLEREVSRAARIHASLAVLALDVDHFKSINDEFGHLGGDRAIQEIGALLRGCARIGDVVARTGGEEFMLLAPETDAPGAMILANRIVEAFREHEFQAVAGRRRITASIGVVAERVLDEHSAEDMRARADEALYAAKRSGRDRVCSWPADLRAGPAALSSARERAR